jgi:CBS domain-containing protein
VRVKEIMTTRVITVTGDTPVPVIAGLLRDNRISGVPVVDADGSVVGLVSEYDLLARSGETAGEVMTSSVITVSEDTDVDDVRHLLIERRIRRVPVTSGQRLARRLTLDELSGGTFTVSNLGMYGIRQFTAVINPPQAAILAIGEAVRQPVVRGGQVTVGTTMALTLSIDHRAVDGAVAAAFLTALRELIEEPLCIVV